MKKMIISAALLAFSLAAGEARASGGASVCELGLSTPTATAVVCYSGTATLYTVALNTGTANDYCVVFDTNVITNVTLAADSATGMNRLGHATVTTTTAQTAAEPSNIPPRDVTKGLVAIKSAATARCMLYYKP